LHAALGDLVADFPDQRIHVARKVHQGEVRFLAAGLGELDELGQHVGHALHLARDAVVGLGAHRRRGVVGARELGGEADHLEWVLEVVHDRSGEATDNGEALGLRKPIVGGTHAGAEVAHEFDANFGRRSITLRNSARLRKYASVAVSAVAIAERGASSISAISPK
jgi:hypothetical protein